MQCLLFIHWNNLQSTGILYSIKAGVLNNILAHYYFKWKTFFCYNRFWAQKASLCSFGLDLAFFSLALCEAWQSFAEEEERWLKRLCDFWGDLRLNGSWTDRRTAEVDMWSIDKLDSSNWTTCKFQIKHLLLARGLWGLVEGTEELQEEATYSTLVTTLEARDSITLSYAQQALVREEQRLKGESKASGSAATGGSTGRALLG